MIHYFIAVLPDPVIREEVTAFKLECDRLFEARHSLKSPPHLTLIPPFRWPPGKRYELREALVEFAAQEMPFAVELENFNCFEPRVLYVDVKKNEELKALQARLAGFLDRRLGFRQKRGHGFNPHMTIAHRDLKEERFSEAWAHFSQKRYRRQFTEDKLALLRHSNGKWEVEAWFPMG